MKIVLLGPIAAWQLYTVDAFLIVGFLVGAFFFIQYKRKNKGKK